MFVEMMPLLTGRTVMITVARLDDKTQRVNVVPAQAKADVNVPLVPRKRKEMTFVYADTISVWKFTEEEGGEGPDAWEFRYYDTVDQSWQRKSKTVGTVEQYPNKAAARQAVSALLLKT